MNDRPFTKNWASPPGDTILDALEELGLTQKELAERLDVTKKHVNDLIRGRANITAETAVKLETVLGEPAQFWMKRDSDYRLALARRKAMEQAKADAEWLQTIPYAQMANMGWVRKVTHKGEKVLEALNFFGVSSVEAWNAQAARLCPAYHDSGAFERKTGSVAAWVRKAELESQQRRVDDFDKEKLKTKLPALRELAGEADPEKIAPLLEKRCAECGVAVVITPAPRGCPACGATWFPTPNNALVALSLRHKSNDQLWFALFHELGHLIKHGKKMRFIEGIDGLDQSLEDEASRFAAAVLIPHDSGYDELANKPISDKSVIAFANKIGTAPGIVVGRLQRDGLLNWKSELNKLKVRYVWKRS